MKKLFTGIILSIILTLCFYNVQAESGQVASEQAENEIVAEVQNEAKEKSARSAEENGIQPYAEETIYRDIKIVGNRGNSNDSDIFIRFILGSHETEKVKVIATNTSGQNVNNPDVEFSTEDTSIATVDNTGTIKAKKVGKTDLIVSGGGHTTRVTIEVYPAFKFSDFTNAKVEMVKEIEVLEWQSIMISEVTNLNSNVLTNTYYGIITTNNTKPEISYKDVNNLDYETMKNKYKISSFSIKNNNTLIWSAADLTSLNIPDSEEYYLWIYQETTSDDAKGSYYNENGQEIRKSGKYVLEAKKIDLKPRKVNIPDGNSSGSKSDPTQAPGKTLPKTGIGTIIIAVISIIAVSAVGVVTYIKYDKYKQLSKFVK